MFTQTRFVVPAVGRGGSQIVRAACWERSSLFGYTNKNGARVLRPATACTDFLYTFRFILGRRRETASDRHPFIMGTRKNRIYLTNLARLAVFGQSNNLNAWMPGRRSFQRSCRCHCPVLGEVRNLAHYMRRGREQDFQRVSVTFPTSSPTTHTYRFTPWRRP
jgi:hypothetical protein